MIVSRRLSDAICDRSPSAGGAAKSEQISAIRSRSVPDLRWNWPRPFQISSRSFQIVPDDLERAFLLFFFCTSSKFFKHVISENYTGPLLIVKYGRVVLQEYRAVRMQTGSCLQLLLNRWIRNQINSLQAMLI